MNKDSRITLIGLGAMGGRVGSRLLAQGHRVTVFNRDPARAAALVEAGATMAESPSIAVRDSDLVLTCVRGTRTEIDMANGSTGFLPSMKPGAMHISLSTLAPETARELAGLHEKNGTTFLSCPMQGRAQAIEAGQLMLWASGPKDALESADPVLRAFASNTVYLGPSVELAPAAKLAVNMLMFANIELFAEASAYLQRCRLDPEQVFGVLTASMFSTPLFKGIAAGLKGDHASDGTNVGTSLLDLQLLMHHANGLGAQLPAAAAVTEQFGETVRQGYGNLAQTAVVLPLSTS